MASVSLRSLCLIIVVVVSSSFTHAEQSEEKQERVPVVADSLGFGGLQDAGEETLDEGYFDWIVEQRNSWSTEVVELGSYVDGFLGGEEAIKQTNNSFIKIGMFGRWSEGAEFEVDPRFKFRLDLPRTQKRYRLVLENDSPESLTPAERDRENAANALNPRDVPSSGFFRVLSGLDDWRFKGDIGIRFSSPISPFVRGRAERLFAFSEAWSLRLESQPFYFVTDGFGFIQSVYFDKAITQDALLRFKSEAQWNEENKFWQFGEVISFSRKIDDKAVVSHSVGWGGQNKPELQTTAYYVNLTYRYRLYKDWLFAEVTPEVLWAIENDFQDDTSVTFGIEMIFAK